MNIRETLLENFKRYVKIYTTSDPNSETVPSSKRQFDLAKVLKAELEELGLHVWDSDKCYVYGKLEKNAEGYKPIGFISHMDTAPDFTGLNVNPQVIENYDGLDIKLGGHEDIILSPNDFPELKDKKGKTLITSDGTTLLGADDKAGLAEIMTTLKYLKENKDFKHGDIYIGFTPDEEIGRGADYFDVENFKADFAYTVDGGGLAEMEYENFNAASCKVIIKGRNVHPGSAKLKMKNSLVYAFELFSMLPQFDRPEHTEKREGFIHLNDLNGNVEEVEMIFIIRDHDMKKFEEKKELMKKAVEFMKEKHKIDIILDMEDSYYNMREVLEKDMTPIERAKKAMKNVGLTPKISPIRGGTDGAQLSYKGLPCPNIFTGGYNFHGRYEYAVLEEMEKSVETILEIIKG